MSTTVIVLYLLCLVFLPSFSGYVLVKDWRSPINRHFAYLSLALFGWVLTLFVFLTPLSPHALLVIGRLNFAFAALALAPGYLFVRELAETGVLASWIVWAVGWSLALISLCTPLVDRSEALAGSIHITSYGLLFTLYVLYCLAVISAALVTALRPSQHVTEQRRSQLRFMAVGIAATGLIAIVSNILLPGALADFRFIHVGPISTIFFLGAVGVATFWYHLFDVYIIFRATVVYAGIIALALEVYSLALNFLASFLPFGHSAERDFAATLVVLIINAFTQERLRTWLSHLVDRLTKRTPLHRPLR